MPRSPLSQRVVFPNRIDFHVTTTSSELHGRVGRCRKRVCIFSILSSSISGSCLRSESRWCRLIGLMVLSSHEESATPTSPPFPLSYLSPSPSLGNCATAVIGTLLPLSVVGLSNPFKAYFTVQFDTSQEYGVCASRTKMKRRVHAAVRLGRDVDIALTHDTIPPSHPVRLIDNFGS